MYLRASQRARVVMRAKGLLTVASRCDRINVFPRFVVAIARNYIMKRRIERLGYVLNDGERYDPSLWFDRCHIARYHFATQFITEKDSVLDLACGTGYGTAIVADKCNRVLGVDISPIAVDYARRSYARANASFVVSEFFSHVDTSDIVVSFETIEHIMNDDFEMILEKLVSLAKKRVICSVPYREVPGNNRHHYHFNLSEANFDSLRQSGIVRFFYQIPDGEIHTTKPNTVAAQNLIFVFERKIGVG